MNRPSSYLKGAWKVRMALLEVFHPSAWSVEIVGKSPNKSPFVSLHSSPSSRPICYSPPAFASVPPLSLCGNRTQDSQIFGGGLAIAVERGSSGVGFGGFSSIGAAFERKRVGVMPASTIAVGGQEVMEEEKMDPVQHRLMFDDECILVDEKDNVVGHDSKYNCHLMEKIEKENLLHRAFSVFLFNSKNELLLQKRSATKVTFPMVWTNTCCSHPLYRDSELIKENNLGVRNAAQRKLFDELGIEAPDAPVDDFTCLGRILYKAASDGKWGEHELDYLVFMKRDVTVKPNPEEVSDVMYVTKEQLQELVQKAKAGKDGVKLSPWFQLVVENFLYDWWKRLEQGTLAEVADMKTIHKLV